MHSKEDEVVIMAFKVLKTLSAHLEPEFILSKILPVTEECIKNESE